jgi:hypothetical protein
MPPDVTSEIDTDFNTDIDAGTVATGYAGESSGSGIDPNADSVVPDYTDENSEPDSELNISTNPGLLFLTGHQHPNTTLLQSEEGKLIFTSTNTNGAKRTLSDSMLTTGIGIPTKKVEFLVLLTLPGTAPGQHTQMGYYTVTITPKGVVSVSDILHFE